MDASNRRKVIWHTDIIPSVTRRALVFLSKEPWLQKSSWYLAGGTALALQVGHRESLDLDFFTSNKNFSGKQIRTRLPEKTWITDIDRAGTLYGRLLGAKVSFIAYPFFLPKQPPLRYGTVRVLDERDIAVMKIVALSQRGVKRDFLDLYWYCCNRERLLEVLLRLPYQYPTVAHDYHHIIKSLTYFDDAEADPMPQLFFKVTWPEVKAFFKHEVVGISRDLLVQ